MAKIVNKLAAGLILALFVLSILPAVLAETDGASEIGEGSEVAEEDVKKDVNEDKVKRVQLKLEEVKDKIKLFREKSEELKEKYQFAKSKVAEQKLKLVDLRDQVDNCRQDNDSCSLRKLDLKNGVKIHLEKTLELIESSLERLVNRVNELDSLTEEEKESLLLEIETLQEKLNLHKDEILAGLTEESTAQEYREAIKEVKSLWQESKHIQRKVIANMVNSRLDNLLEKHREMVDGMQLRIDDLAEQGVDTTTLVSLRDRFISAVNDAEVQFEKVKRLTPGVGEGAGEDWREAHQDMMKMLKEAKEILRKFLAEYKNLREELKEEETDDSESDDAENETATETNESAESEE
ncbi:MAG TPA: hypothetical protein VJC39_01940 [Candidatus Nanoarchaeia archaeon]|nr:hypothetical protein [Candidatus Nanoarchaeia archaeon]